MLVPESDYSLEQLKMAWQTFVKQSRKAALRAVTLANLDDILPDYLNTLFWSYSRDGSDSVLEGLDTLTKLVATISPTKLEVIVGGGAEWLQAVAAKAHWDDTRIWKAWHLLWSVNMGIAIRQDAVDQALNHPAGKLAESLLIAIDRCLTEGSSPIPEFLIERANQVALEQSPNGQLARVTLSSRLAYLAHAVPSVAQSLIAKMNDPQCPEFLQLWQGFAWLLRADANLIRELTPGLLEAIRRMPGQSQYEHALRRYVVSISLELPEFPRNDLRDALYDLDSRSLEDVATALRFALDPDDDQINPAEVWTNHVKPWLTQCWPKDRSKQTAATSDRLASLCLKAGEAMPDAVETVKEWLVPDGQGIVWSLNEKAELVGKYPAPCLELLARLINKSRERYSYLNLEKVLNSIEVAWPSVRQEDSRFVELENLI